MSKSISAPPIEHPIVFETEFIDGLKTIFEENIVFNQVLGLKIRGVISAALDAMGGLAVMAAIGAKHLDEDVAARLLRFGKLGTIDLRIDYLRPAIGESFTLQAEVLRLGSRVASTRMAFLGADGKLLSTGAGAYIVS